MAVINRIGGGSTEPSVVNGYRASRRSRNIVRDTLDGTTVVTLRPLGLRSGTLNLVYMNEADALAAVQLHEQPATFTLTTSQAGIDMTYAVGEGDVELELSSGCWLVLIPFQEVT